MSNYYRVTWDGYIEGEYDNEEDARQALIDFIENNELDNYNREWQNLISVEKIE